MVFQAMSLSVVFKLVYFSRLCRRLIPLQSCFRQLQQILGVYIQGPAHFTGRFQRPKAFHPSL